MEPSKDRPSRETYLPFASGQTLIDLLAAEGGTLTVKEAAVILGSSEQGVMNDARAFRMVACQDSDGVWRVPMWQFNKDRGQLRGLPEILALLQQRPGHSHITPFIFFLSPLASLGDRSPLEALRAGMIGDAMRAAQRYLD